jgi:hypothetical protein
LLDLILYEIYSLKSPRMRYLPKKAVVFDQENPVHCCVPPTQDTLSLAL